MLVAIVRIPAPPNPEAAAGMEQRFAANLPLVQQASGFLGFELLRPAEGATHYLSISRWQSRADFDAWAGSQANAQAHSRPSAAHGAGSAPGGAGASHAASAAGHGEGSGGGGPRGGVELYEVAET